MTDEVVYTYISDRDSSLSGWRLPPGWYRRVHDEYQGPYNTEAEARAPDPPIPLPADSRALGYGVGQPRRTDVVHAHVVMSNDFPDSVWPTSEDAELYCSIMNTAEEARERAQRQVHRARIYYRCYDYAVQDPLRASIDKYDELARSHGPEFPSARTCLVEYGVGTFRWTLGWLYDAKDEQHPPFWGQTRRSAM
jgi:hypothetical protein